MKEKRFDAYGNPIRFTAAKIIPTERAEKKRRGDCHAGIDPDSLGLKSLMKHHLCKGEFSDCVSRRTCDCLDVCRFGQRYIALTKETKETTI